MRGSTGEAKGEYENEVDVTESADDGAGEYGLAFISISSDNE